MVDILFLIPATCEGKAGCASEYLGISYIAGYIKDKFSYHILNADLYGLTSAQILSIIDVKKPKIVAVTVIQPAIRQTKLVVEGLKQNNENIFICIGGHYPTLAYKKILENIQGLDCIIIGEGEFIFGKLAKKVLGNHDWKDVRGIAYKSGGQIYVNHNNSMPIELDNLPFPVRDGLQETLIRGGRFNVVSSRGCYGRCTFCSSHEFNSEAGLPSWRGRSPESVVSEMEYLHKDYGADYIAFIDDNYFGKGESGIRRVRRIGELILEKELKINYEFFCRADNVKEDLFCFLKSTGLKLVWIGVESNLEKDLRNYNKNISITKVKESFEILEKLGIEYKFGFIMVDPYTVLEDIKEKYKFIEEYTAKGRITSYRYLLARLRVYDRTPIKKRLSEDGKLIVNDFTKGYDSYYISNIVLNLYNIIGEFYIKHVKPIQDMVEKFSILLHNIGISIEDIHPIDQDRHIVEKTFLYAYEAAINYVDSNESTSFERLLEKEIEILLEVRKRIEQCILSVSEKWGNIYNFNIVVCESNITDFTLMDVTTSKKFTVGSDLYNIIKYCTFNVENSIREMIGGNAGKLLKRLEELLEQGVITNHSFL